MNSLRNAVHSVLCSIGYLSSLYVKLKRWRPNSNANNFTLGNPSTKLRSAKLDDDMYIKKSIAFVT